VLITVLSALGLAVAAVALASVFRPGPAPAQTIHPSPGARSSPGDQVTVPDVTGQAGTQAVSVLQGVGLAATTTTTSSCGPADDGKVLGQNPSGGAMVNKGTSVALGVCNPRQPPPATVTVPNVVGMTQQSATATLQGAGLAAATTTTSSCGPADDGKVLSQNPSGGVTVNKGTSDALSVCSAPKTVAVPNVVGLSQPSAIAMLQNVGLSTATTTTSNCGTVSGTVSNGDVVTQDPAANTTVSQGSSVTIAVCNATATLIP